MNNLPMRAEWETLVGSLEPQVEMDEVIPPGIYTINVDTFNGDAINYRKQYQLPLQIRDSYIVIGGHIVHNAYFNGDEVIVGCASFQSRVVVYNRPHWFRRRSNA